jgi:hypothetical protein
MFTVTHIQSRGARRRAVHVLLAAGAISGLCLAAGTAVGRSAASGNAPSLGLLHVTRTVATTTTSAPSYDWPLKPFDRQHPVRAFFNDPRVGGHSHAFHFGIDIAAPDGTPVYAVEAGTVYFDSARAIAVVSRDRGHSFGYWHIVPLVKSHQYVARHQLLGTIEAPWGHVHFAERRNGQYVNPLRPGGLGPYTDHTPPTISNITFTAAARSRVDILVDALDMPDPRVPGVWADEPVTPVLLQWRLAKTGSPTPAWRTAVDFRWTMLPAGLYTKVYAAATRQNHPGEPGRYCFNLVRGWSPAASGDGSYRLQVAAGDTRGNRAVATLTFTVVNGQVSGV